MINPIISGGKHPVISFLVLRNNFFLISFILVVYSV
jgi:hypothetical protein